MSAIEQLVAGGGSGECARVNPLGRLADRLARRNDGDTALTQAREFEQKEVVFDLDSMGHNFSHGDSPGMMIRPANLMRMNESISSAAFESAFARPDAMLAPPGPLQLHRCANGVVDEMVEKFQRFQMVPPAAGPWIDQFLRPSPTMQQQLRRPDVSWADQFSRQASWADQFDQQQQQNSEWANNFERNMLLSAHPESTTEPKIDQRLLASLKTSKNSKMRQSKFVDFLSKLSSGEISLDEEAQTVVEHQSHVDQDWSEQFADLYDPQRSASDWASQFQQKEGTPFLHSQTDDWAQAFDQQQNNEEWADDFVQSFPDVNDWVNEFDSFDWNEYVGKMQDGETNSQNRRHIYVFAEHNPFLADPQAYERGQELMKDGNLSDAVLAFEAAVQQNDANALAWCLLGRCNADNEGDSQAIAALSRTVELDPYNLEALLMLGVSYTNDLEQSQAVSHLKSWLENHPDFVALHDAHDSSKFEDIYNHPDGHADDQHSQVLDMFTRAAEFRPDDASVHTVLGVLHHLRGGYEPALMCFRRALELRPNDATLWNKLGATQANGSRSPEAVLSYKRALELKPNFVRALANLGISFANQGMHTAAAQAYLATLSRNPRAENVWNYLRISLLSMDRHDLLPLIETRKVDNFRSHFSF